MRHAAALTLAAVLLCTALPAEAPLDPHPLDRGGAGLGLALRRLPVAGRVLYVTAHPDDENNGALVTLSRGRGLRAALLTLTRGEGGQNAIGPELFEALGVLRTGELEAVHRFDRVEQYFSAAYEFGFSFSLEETLGRWGHEDTLGDVVRIVRAFRPDVILTLPLDSRDHQHHVAAARLAREAFRAAADPARFPQQLREGLRPWQARKIYQGGVGGGDALLGDVAPVPLATLDYDPLLGMSWAELGSLARAQHRCQAARQLRASPGAARGARYALVDAEPALEGPEADIFDGIDISLSGLVRLAAGPADRIRPALEAAEADARRAQEAYDARAPEATLPALRSGLARLRALREQLTGGGAVFAETRDELQPRLAAKEDDFLEALALAHGLAFEVTAADGDVVPGERVTVTASVWNHGREPVRADDVALRVPDGWSVERTGGAGGALEPRHGLTLTYAVTVAATARPTRPYWRRGAGLDRYLVEEPADRGLPWSPPAVVATLRYVSGGVPAGLERPAVLRYEGRWVGGEKRKVLNVVPALSVRVAPEVTVFPLASRGARRVLRVAVLSNASDPAPARLRIEAPPGWRVEPVEVSLPSSSEGEEATALFTLTAPVDAPEGRVELRAVAIRDGREFREGYEVVAYDHVEERHFFLPAVSRALALDVRVAPAARVGYVPGAGDELPEAIRQLGVPLEILSEGDLAQGDLSRYSTIVTGVRAYQRREVRAHHRRLMRYAEEGGNLVLQYHRWEFNALAPPSGAEADGPSPFAPYPARVTTSRVTDETAPVEGLVPDHPLLRVPNRITARDWQGWVQERGIQLLEARDPRYTDLLAAADPFPLNPGTKKGMLVEARVGKGTWTYVGLALFRQLSAGVPGAYRLLANLLGRPRGR